jgi:hypothetical protein
MRLGLSISLFTVLVNKDVAIGFSALTFENNDVERSFLSIFYQPQNNTLWLGILFFNFRFYP